MEKKTMEEIEGQFLLLDITKRLETAVHSALNEKTMPANQEQIYLASKFLKSSRLNATRQRRAGINTIVN